MTLDEHQCRTCFYKYTFLLLTVVGMLVYWLLPKSPQGLSTAEVTAFLVVVFTFAVHVGLVYKHPPHA